MSGGYTPSDFPLARLSQPQLDQLFGGVRGIEDVYPLTPLQQGILFHALYAPESGVYVEHLSCTLQGPLDTAAFTAAWQQVMAAHPILRSSFRWEDLGCACSGGASRSRVVARGTGLARRSGGRTARAMGGLSRRRSASWV